MRHGSTRARPTPGRKQCPDAVTVDPVGDPLWHVAERAADALSERGYAFVEDDKLGALVAALRSFLTASGLPVNAGENPGVAPTVSSHGGRRRNRS